MPTIDKQGVMSQVSPAKEISDLENMMPTNKTASAYGDHCYLRNKGTHSRDISKILEPISKSHKKKRDFVLKGDNKTF